MRKQVSTVFESVIPANARNSDNTGMYMGDFISFVVSYKDKEGGSFSAGHIYKCVGTSSYTLTYTMVNGDLRELGGSNPTRITDVDTITQYIAKGGVKVLPTGYEIFSPTEKREILSDILTNLGIALPKGKTLPDITSISGYNTLYLRPWGALSDSYVARVKVALERRGIIVGEISNAIYLI